MRPPRRVGRLEETVHLAEGAPSALHTGLLGLYVVTAVRVILVLLSDFKGLLRSLSGRGKE